MKGGFFRQIGFTGSGGGPVDNGTVRNGSTTLSLRVEEAPGILARLTARLRKFGYHVHLERQQTDSTVDNARCLTLALQGPLPIPEEVLDALRRFDSCLEILSDSPADSGTGNADDEDSALELQAAAADVLRSVFGTQAHSEAARVAERHPPDREPLQFLDGCRALVGGLLGDAIAEEMFAALHARVEAGFDEGLPAGTPASPSSPSPG